MRTENINRKFKLHDERRLAAQLPEQLHGLDVVGFVRVDEFSGELLNSFGQFSGGVVPPLTRIYRNAQPNRIDAWLLDLLRQAGIGERFYLRTGLEYFPWADCRVLDHRWLESLRRVMGPNQGFIAHTKNGAAMTIGAQYEVLGFARDAAALANPPAAAPAAAGSPAGPAPYTLAALSADPLVPGASVQLPPVTLTTPADPTQPPASPAPSRTPDSAPHPARPDQPAGAVHDPELLGANHDQPLVGLNPAQPPRLTGVSRDTVGAGQDLPGDPRDQPLAGSSLNQPPAPPVRAADDQSLVGSTLIEPPAGSTPPAAARPVPAMTGPAMTAPPTRATTGDPEATVLLSAVSEREDADRATTRIERPDAVTRRITRDQVPAPENQGPQPDSH
ncbi:hypothetical protein [Nocardia sp. NPDC057668]|uniref:hypothetical protein n=1 Tax=Nocardia sp. NPDC057668 TaxID=3346202 RepID=UPI0036725EBB